MTIKIGEIIHQLVKDRGIKAKVVAEYVNVSESTLFGIYKRESVDIDKLILFSRLLNKNLFLYYLDEEPLKSMFNNDMQSLKNENLELESELNKIREKVKDQADIIEAQKKVIFFHEEKSKKNESKKPLRKNSKG